MISNLAILSSDDSYILLSAVIIACKRGFLNMQPEIVISDNLTSPALRRAEKAGIRAWHLSTANFFGSDAILDEVTAQLLTNLQIDLVLLLGCPEKRGPAMLLAFPNKILDVPASVASPLLIFTLQEIQSRGYICLSDLKDLGVES